MFRRHRADDTIRKIVVNAPLSAFVDQGPGDETKGIATFANLIPAGWYVLSWTADITEGFAGGTAADIRFGVGNDTNSAAYTPGGAVLGQPADSVDMIAGEARNGSNAAFNGLNVARDLVLTLDIGAGSQDFSDLTAGNAVVTMRFTPAHGY
jgi:hypothetical protein